MDIGTVAGLAARAVRGGPPASFERLLMHTGIGIDSDLHADPLSPRQLLLASSGAYADFDLPVHALRENLLIDADTAQLASGTVLQIGADVRLRMMFQCEACGRLDAMQPGLARRVGKRRGMLARVLTGGVIRAGAPVRDLGVLTPAWDDDWRGRVRQVLDAAPGASVIEYRTLALLAGIQSSYCRAFPRVLARLGPSYAAGAVAAHSVAALPRWQGEGLFERY